VKILLLADIPGWIVDRIADRLIEGIDCEFRKGCYGCMSTAEILGAARDCDLIHYLNWDIKMHWSGILEAKKPILMSIRSHRFPLYVREVAKQVHVHTITPSLAKEFPGCHHVPDGLMIEPQPLRVGFAGKCQTYKGVGLIREACEEMGAAFCVAESYRPEEMPSFYRSIDVLVCASQNEGFSTVVMEALAINKPVVSARCGTPFECELPGVTWVDRTVEDIKRGLYEHWPSRYLEPFAWARVCPQMAELYRVLSH
jgi:hypothetical protein